VAGGELDARQVLKWRLWLSEKGVGESAASTQIGRDRSYLRKLFSRAAAGEAVDPSASAVDALGLLLGRSHEEMMGRAVSIEVSPESPAPSFIEVQAAKVAGKMLRTAANNAKIIGGRLSVEDVLSWWSQSDGLIDPNSSEIESCDVVAPPNDGDELITPTKIGEKSLAAKVMTGEKLADMLRLLSEAPRDQRLEMVRSYRHAAESKEPVMTGPHSMTISHPGQSPFVVRFFRIQLPARTPDGSKFVLNYSFPI
jgi:hypothetical protein